MLQSVDDAAWSSPTISITQYLWAVRIFADGGGESILAAGDDVMVFRAAGATAWEVLPPPEGGWGQLRALTAWTGQFHAVGLGGVIWSSEDVHGPWRRETSGTDAGLLAVGADYATITAAGAAGTRRGPGGPCGPAGHSTLGARDACADAGLHAEPARHFGGSPGCGGRSCSCSSGALARLG